MKTPRIRPLNLIRQRDRILPIAILLALLVPELLPKEEQHQNALSPQVLMAKPAKPDPVA